jgi:ferredoxin-nitrate reductase
VPFGRIAPSPATALNNSSRPTVVKAIWILRESGGVGADIGLIEKALRHAELVPSDAYHPTATSKFAHVLLPAAQWSEEGVMTNSERRSHGQTRRTAREPLPDWKIFALCRRWFGRLCPTHVRIFRQFAAPAGTPCGCSGIAIESSVSPLQWPYQRLCARQPVSSTVKEFFRQRMEE